MKGKFLTVTFVVLALSLITAACAQPTPEKVVETVVVTKVVEKEVEVTREVMVAPEVKKPIKIGVVFPFTGPAAYVGEATFRASTMAVEEINAEGGILGVPVQLAACDNEGTTEKTVACVRRLIELDDVDLVTGMTSSGHVLASKDIVQEYEVPLLANLVSNAKITEDTGRAGGNIWVFRFPPHDGMMARVFAGFVAERVDSVCMMATNNDYGRGGLEVTRPFLEAAGVEVLVDDYHEMGQADYRPIITRWKGLNCEGIYLLSWSQDAAVFINQTHELGLELPVFGRATMSSEEFMDGLTDPSYAEVILEVAQLLIGSEPEFEQRYKAMYGILPHEHATTGYVGIRYVAAEAFRIAIEETGEATRSSIRDALEKVSVETPYFGVIEFDEYNQAHPNAAVKAYENGEWRVLEYIPTR